VEGSVSSHGDGLEVSSTQSGLAALSQLTATTLKQDKGRDGRCGSHSIVKETGPGAWTVLRRVWYAFDSEILLIFLVVSSLRFATRVCDTRATSSGGLTPLVCLASTLRLAALRVNPDQYLCF
jgi:hypothetical protein